jgi:hypothetical protein
MLAGSVLPPLPVDAPPDAATAAPLPPLVVVPPAAMAAVPPAAMAPVPPASSEPELWVVLPHAAGASPKKTGSNNLHVVKPSMSPSRRAYARASVTVRQNAAPLRFFSHSLRSSWTLRGWAWGRW